MRWVKILSLLILIFVSFLGISNAQQGLILSGFSGPETLWPLNNEIITDFNLIDYQRFSIQLEPPAKVTLKLHTIAGMQKAIDSSA